MSKQHQLIFCFDCLVEFVEPDQREYHLSFISIQQYFDTAEGSLAGEAYA